jgi:hypothetical protein
MYRVRNDVGHRKHWVSVSPYLDQALALPEESERPGLAKLHEQNPNLAGLLALS